MTAEATGPPEEAAQPEPDLLATELWEFALQLYAAPGVEAACLRLQDRHGCDVLLVLFAFWMESRQSVLDAALAGDAARLARAWRVEVVEPLRRARRGLLRPALPPELGVAGQQLRQQVAGVELAAERLALQALARVAAAVGRDPTRAPPGKADNLGALGLLTATTAPDLGIIRDALARLEDARTAHIVKAQDATISIKKP